MSLILSGTPPIPSSYNEQLTNIPCRHGQHLPTRRKPSDVLVPGCSWKEEAYNHWMCDHVLCPHHHGNPHRKI